LDIHLLIGLLIYLIIERYHDSFPDVVNTEYKEIYESVIQNF